MVHGSGMDITEFEPEDIAITAEAVVDEALFILCQSIRWIRASEETQYRLLAVVATESLRRCGLLPSDPGRDPAYDTPDLQEDVSGWWG